VIVLLKGILPSVTAWISAQQNAQQQANRTNGPNVPNGPRPDGSAQQPNGNANPEPVELSPEEIEATRTREITAKAVTGILLLLLKWLKVSRKDIYYP
jgi:hypothetical protein